MNVIFTLFSVYALLAILHSTTATINDDGGWRFVWMPLSVLIFLLSATRVGGSDWENYEYLYIYMSHAESWFDAILKNALFEPGYVVLNYVFNLLSDDRRWLIKFESAINAYAIWLTLTRFKGGPIILIWLFPLQFANILGVRQTFATSLFIIAITTLHGRTSVVASIASGLIHISSFLLVFGRAIQKFRFTLRWAALGLVSIIFFSFLFKYFLYDKINNYIDNAVDLTDLTGLEVFFGKGLTVLMLLGINTIARHLPKHTPTTSLVRASSSSRLYLLYFALMAASVPLPALARLLTPFELLIVWSVCEVISDIRSRPVRVLLTFVIAVISTAKMLKIWSQFGEMYSVCFFCA